MKKIIRKILAKYEKKNRIKLGSKTKNLENFEDIKMLDDNSVYNHFLYKYSTLPKQIVEHRNFFTNNKRGFGEDAFHAFWYELILNYDLKKFLEIGVYRGQTISLWLLITDILKIDAKVMGISPFDPVGDSVSEYIEIEDYYADTINNCSRFSKKSPLLCKAFSNESAGIECIKSEKWDLIYIDGSHDYPIVKEDYKNSRLSINDGGFIVFDDSGLSSNFDPGYIAFKGHPGPSYFVDELITSGLKPFIRVGHLTIFKF